MIELNEEDISQMIVDALAEKMNINTRVPWSVEFEKRDNGKIYAQVWPAQVKDKEKVQ